jgi:hypothetical protein
MASLLFSVIDHLVFATSDMEQCIRGLAELLGVTAALGGRHPKWRTQNALLSLGPQVHLVFMGPDDNPPDPDNPRPFGIDGLSSPRLVTWVARTDDLQKTASEAKLLGIDLGEVQSGSRKKPDGTLLQWQMTDLAKDRENAVVPFFINWGATAHPGGTSPQGCRLARLRVFHPEADRITHVLSLLGIELEVEKGPVGLEALVRAPRGQVILK